MLVLAGIHFLPQCYVVRYQHEVSVHQSEFIRRVTKHWVGGRMQIKQPHTVQLRCSCGVFNSWDFQAFVERQ